MDFSLVRSWQIPQDGAMRDVLKVTNSAAQVIWRKKLLVQFNGNGGTSSEASRYVKYELAVGALPSAERENYIMLGWYTAATGGSSVSAGTVITKPVTFYAQWEPADDLLITDQDDGIVTSSGNRIKIVE